MVPDGAGGQTLVPVVPIVKSTVNVTARPQTKMSTVLGTVTGQRQKNGFVPTKNATVSIRRRSEGFSGGSRGGARGVRPPSLNLDQSELEEPKNFFRGTASPPPPSPLSQGLDQHCPLSTVLGTVTGNRQKNGFVPTKNVTVSRRRRRAGLTGGKCKRYPWFVQS